MSNFVIKLTCLLTWSCLVQLHPSRPLLPLCIESATRTEEIDLRCTVTSGQFLDYNDVRAFTQGRSDKRKFNVSIDCKDGAVIHLPWPFSAVNVISLQVDGCETVGFISEMFDTYPHANELKHVSVVDVTHRITIKELYESIHVHDTIPRDYDCGMNGTVVEVFRNTRYKFPPPSGSIEELMMLEELISKNTLEKLLSHTSVCMFPYLQYLEESGKRSLSSVRFKLMEANSLYPELTYYVLRNNSLPTVPKEFRNLAIGFLPKLQVLDLSNNDITSLDFDVNSFRNPVKPLVVILRNNKVRYVGKALVDSLLRSGSVVLDLRDNPLVCSCELFRYADHLLSLQGNMDAKDAYSGLTCMHENRGTQETHRVTETSLRHKLCPASL